MNENLILFEGQEVKVKTDKGETLINLGHSARICGLLQSKPNGTQIVRWTRVKEKLISISSGIQDGTPQYLEEIQYILDEIENTDDRNAIYMSSWLSKRLAMECNSDKANNIKTS